MRLVDLEPRWVAETVFVFRCPCCLGTPRALWLSCKSAPMGRWDQVELFRSAGLEPTGKGAVVVCSEEPVAWQVTGRDFESMTVTPSIHAGAAGHWHGYITAGKILTV